MSQETVFWMLQVVCLERHHLAAQVQGRPPEASRGHGLWQVSWELHPPHRI